MQAQDSFNTPQSTSSSTSYVESLHSHPGRLSSAIGVMSSFGNNTHTSATSPLPLSHATTLPSNWQAGDYGVSNSHNNLDWTLNPSLSMSGNTSSTPFTGFPGTGISPYPPNNQYTTLPTSGNMAADAPSSAPIPYYGGHVQQPITPTASNWASSTAPPAGYPSSYGQNVNYTSSFQENNDQNQNPSSYGDFDGTDSPYFDYGNDYEREVKASNTSQKPAPSSDKPSKTPNASLKTSRTNSNKLTPKHSKDTTSPCDSCGSVGAETKTSDSVLRKVSHKLRSAKEWLKRISKAAHPVV